MTTVAKTNPTTDAFGQGAVDTSIEVILQQQQCTDVSGRVVQKLYRAGSLNHRATGKVHVYVALKEGQDGKSGIGPPCANLRDIGVYGSWSANRNIWYSPTFSARHPVPGWRIWAEMHVQYTDRNFYGSTDQCRQE